VSCDLANNAPCGPAEVCVDDASDGCDANQDASCPGTCQGAFRTPACGGFGAGNPCYAGYSCTLDPRTLQEPEQSMICVEDGQMGACARGERCGDGFLCTTNVGDCVPDRVDCAAPVMCDAAERYCPYGYTVSRVGVKDGVAECTGPCVPVTRCECTTDAQCPAGAACDRRAGTCVTVKPWEAPHYCALPFEDGTCNNLVAVFVFENGTCTEKPFSGCGGIDGPDGNLNRFASIEECMAICAGQPAANACPDGHEQRPICAGCGLVDNCTKYFVGCAQPCLGDDDCRTPGMTCDPDGFCNTHCP
jgi:hypothetical protein